MAEYVVKWKYKSSLGGPWQEGEVVELDEKLAEAVNNDSPGVLKAVSSKLSAISKSQRAVVSGKNRQVTKAQLALPGDVMSRETPGYGAELLRDGEE